MPADGPRLRRDYDRRLADMGVRMNVWQALAEYLLPRKSDIQTTRWPGTRKTDKLFDSAGLHAARVFAASLAGALMPPSQRWFSLAMRDQDLNRRQDVRVWTQGVRDVCLAWISHSNFTDESQEVLLDLGVFATGSKLIEEAPAGYLGRFGGLRFRAMTIGEYVIAEDPFGRVDTQTRKFMMEAGSLLKRWPDAVLPPGIADKLRNKPQEMVPILHAVYPRPDRKPSLSTGRNKPWASCYLLFDNPETILDEGGFEEFPYVTARWSKVSGDVWGYGLGDDAYPDIRTLNRHVQLYLQAGGKAVDPPLLVDDDAAIQNLTLEPGGINYRRPDSKIEPLESKAHWQIAHDINERLERKINEAFFVDALRLRQQPNMTATEVLALQEEMLRLLGPAAGRLYTEYLSPTIERVVSILARAKQLPPPPPVLLEQGGEVDIVYEGPLARAQKSADLVAIDRVQASRERIAAATGKQDIFDIYDLDEEQRHYATVGGYPGNILRDPQAVAQMRAARQQAQQAAEQMATIERGAVAAGKAAPALKLLPGAQPGQESQAA